jgi:hypothetical protein
LAKVSVTRRSASTLLSSGIWPSLTFVTMSRIASPSRSNRLDGLELFLGWNLPPHHRCDGAQAEGLQIGKMGQNLALGGQGDVPAGLQRCQLLALNPGQVRQAFLTQPEVLPRLLDCLV